MARHKKTQRIIDEARAILVAEGADQHPMTLRQVFYRLVSRQVLENTKGRYDALSRFLVDARCEGDIPWEWIEDRLRRPREVAMYPNVVDFVNGLEYSYRRDVWATQPRRIEAWLEKDALSGIFEDVLNVYGVTLNVGRGYDGWSSIHNAAVRFGSGEDVTILYFGDFDPSGEDMARSLRTRLEECESCPEIVKVALTLDDIARYNLPPNMTKTDDSRAAKHIAKYGEVSSVELDALPASVLRQRIIGEVEARMDLHALRRVLTQDKQERERIRLALQQAS